MKHLTNIITSRDGVKIIKSEYRENDRIRVALLIPHTHPDYTSDFFLSFNGVMAHSYWWNYNNGNKYAFDIITPPKNLAGIADIRNNLAKIAMETNCDYLMWMDSDQIYPPDTIIKMLRHFNEADNGNADLAGLEAVGGLITYKEPPYIPHLYAKKHATKNTYHLARNFPLDQLFKVEAVGFGCVMVKAEVFKRVPKPWFEFNTDENGELLSGEDLGFCIKANMDIVIDPTIVIGHQKLSTFDINNFIDYNKLEVIDNKVNPTVERADEIYSEHIRIK